jgi:hypothetical protein
MVKHLVFDHHVYQRIFPPITPLGVNSCITGVGNVSEAAFSVGTAAHLHDDAHSFALSKYDAVSDGAYNGEGGG